ncbi:hypothetical protein L6R29_05670 [Myxococcota bacterium]|nr:hypothetical protein [Myxococcota bacterium]
MKAKRRRSLYFKMACGWFVFLLWSCTISPAVEELRLQGRKCQHSEECLGAFGSGLFCCKRDSDPSTLGICQSTKVPIGEEICDGLDNNCNGQIDEGLIPQKKEGEILCSSTPKYDKSCGVQRCEGGRYVCKAVEEDCNGHDDNCDGQIDEGLDPDTPQSCYDGPEGTLRDGARCKGGIRNCQDGKWTACREQILPKPEECNNEDDDCDGLIDRVKKKDPYGKEYLSLLFRPCYPADTAGCVLRGGADYECKGPCAVGGQYCENGRWEPCRGAITPKEEICGNKIDDDCDGKIDNGAFCRLELCDGKDNNDDGQTDEPPWYFPEYPTGVCKDTQKLGACATGVPKCIDGRVVCEFDKPKEEECNGFDDDCDGRVDNRPSGGVLRVECSSVHPKNPPCSSGYRECIDGKWSNCLGEITPKPEQCGAGQTGNGVDEDCDGIPDDTCLCPSSCFSDTECKRNDCYSKGLTTCVRSRCSTAP